MLPGQKNFQIYQGDTYIIPVRIRQINEEGNPEPLDLTEHWPSAQIRVNADSAVVTEFGIKYTDAPNGELELSLTHLQTTELTGNYVYDLQTVYIENEGEPDEMDVVRTWMRGQITTTREITR